MKVIEISPGKDAVVVVVMSAEEATHIGHRLNVSSFETFNNYRKENKTAKLHRHPLAEDFLEALAEVGLWKGDC